LIFSASVACFRQPASPDPKASMAMRRERFSGAARTTMDMRLPDG